MGADKTDQQARLAKTMRACCGTVKGEPHAAACRYRRRYRG